MGAAAAAIVAGTFVLALWTESRRPGDSGPGGGGDPGADEPELPHAPTGPGNPELDWSMFEGEFADYVRWHERRRERAGLR